jgi:SAM-dependent methyltransferase
MREITVGRRVADFPREVGFAFARWLRWSPPSWKRRVADGVSAVHPLGEAALARLAELELRYDLSPWPRVCSASEYRESLYVLDLVERFVTPVAPAGPGLDVGSKNGAYLPGLCAARPGRWVGVELDAHRRYLNLATRRGHALGLIQPYPEARYLAGSVLDLEDRYAVVTWFLPFVVVEPLDAWGLPRRFFEPQRLLEHVVERLLPGGVLLIVNQGEREAEAQATLLRSVGATFEALGRMQSEVSPFRLQRFGWRVRG